MDSDEADVAGGTIAALASPLALTIGLILMGKTWKGSAIMLNAFKNSLGTLGFVCMVLIEDATATPDGAGGGGVGESGLDEVGGGAGAWDSFGVMMLVVSALIGIVIGDNVWLQALQILGARRVILVDSVKPFLAAVMASAILGEPAGITLWAGMAVTMSGILIVSLEQQAETPEDGKNSAQPAQAALESIADVRDQPTSAEAVGEQKDVGVKDNAPQAAKGVGRVGGQMVWGYCLAAINVVLDVYGATLTKQFGRGLTPWKISMVRFGSSALILVVFLGGVHAVCAIARSTTVEGKDWVELGEEGGRGERAGRHERNVKEKGGGIFSGWRERVPGWATVPETTPREWGTLSFAVSLTTISASLLFTYALFQLEMGVCQTLTSLAPIYSLAMHWAMEGERPTARACGGTVVACAGIWLFSLVY